MSFPIKVARKYSWNRFNRSGGLQDRRGPPSGQRWCSADPGSSPALTDGAASVRSRRSRQIHGRARAPQRLTVFRVFRVPLGRGAPRRPALSPPPRVAACCRCSGASAGPPHPRRQDRPVGFTALREPLTCQGTGGTGGGRGRQQPLFFFI